MWLCFISIQCQQFNKFHSSRIFENSFDEELQNHRAQFPMFIERKCIIITSVERHINIQQPWNCKNSKKRRVHEKRKTCSKRFSTPLHKAVKMMDEKLILTCHQRLRKLHKLGQVGNIAISRNYNVTLLLLREGDVLFRKKTRR